MPLPQERYPGAEPFVLPPAEHNITRDRISSNTLRVLDRLLKNGFEAHLVGGSVRDLLLGYEPKDFDVATDARPEQVRELFSNSRIIGRRFRLVHVYFKKEIIEVATFRGNPQLPSEHARQNGMILRDNIYGLLEEDAWRRDFTVNALYYDANDHSVIDYTGGLYDLAQGVIRHIGDVRQRYHEDPVRMLRAVRLAVKLSFDIEKHTAEPILELAGLLQNVPPARLFHELNKLFFEGYAKALFHRLRQYGLFAVLFPHTEACLGKLNPVNWLQFLEAAFANTDARVSQDKPVSPGFLLAVLLWPPLQQQIDHLQSTGLALYPALTLAARKVTQQQRAHVALPQRFVIMMREIWSLQYRLKNGCNQKARRLIGHPRFRAAFDFLALRHQAGEPVGTYLKWWRQFIASDWSERERMIYESEIKRAGKQKRG